MQKKIESVNNIITLLEQETTQTLQSLQETLTYLDDHLNENPFKLNTLQTYHVIKAQETISKLNDPKNLKSMIDNYGEQSQLLIVVLNTIIKTFEIMESSQNKELTIKGIIEISSLYGIFTEIITDNHIDDISLDNGVSGDSFLRSLEDGYDVKLEAKLETYRKTHKSNDPFSFQDYIQEIHGKHIHEYDKEAKSSLMKEFNKFNDFLESLETIAVHTPEYKAHVYKQFKTKEDEEVQEKTKFETEQKQLIETTLNSLKAMTESDNKQLIISHKDVNFTIKKDRENKNDKIPYFFVLTISNQFDFKPHTGNFMYHQPEYQKQTINRIFRILETTCDEMVVVQKNAE